MGKTVISISYEPCQSGHHGLSCELEYYNGSVILRDHDVKIFLSNTQNSLLLCPQKTNVFNAKYAYLSLISI